MMAQHSQVRYQKCIVTIRNVYMDDKTVYLDFFLKIFFNVFIIVLWETCVYFIYINTDKLL